jgi:hypothetical protein
MGLVLQDEHFLAKGQDLAVTIVTEQAGEQGSKGREQRKKQMPGYAGRRRRVDGGCQHQCRELTNWRRGPQETAQTSSGAHELEMLALRHQPTVYPRAVTKPRLESV